MGKPKVMLYLDIVSPFAYTAFHVLRNSPIFKQCDVTFVPILLGGLMKACDNRPPLEIKNKDKFIEKERLRWAKAFNVPILPTTPDPFPQPTLNAQRALCAVELQNNHENLAKAFEALYKSFWVEGKAANDAANISAALGSVLGKEATEEVMKKSKEAEAKKRLTDNTNAAFAAESFGLPWFVATNKKGETDTFWGVDHMGLLVEFLELDRGQEPGLRAML